MHDRAVCDYSDNETIRLDMALAGKLASANKFYVMSFNASVASLTQ